MVLFATIEGGEHGFRRMRNNCKKCPRGSARNPLALLPVADGFNGNAQPLRELNLGQPRSPAQAFDLRR